MSEISSTQRDSSRQLEDLKQEHEKKLAKLRQEQQKQEEELRAAGDASVNHIKKSTAERVEAARAQSNEKLEKEGEALRKDYTSLKKRSLSQNEALSEQIRTERRQAEKQIGEVKERELHTVEQSQEKLKDFLENQQEVRSKAYKVTQEEVVKSTRSANEELAKAKLEARQKVEKTNVENREKIDNLKVNNRQMYEDAKTQAERRLNELRTDNEKKVGSEREEGRFRAEQIRDKVKEATVHEQRQGEKNINAIVSENQHRMEATKERALKTNEKVQKVYSNETQRVQTEGEREIADTQMKFESLKRDQKAAHKGELKQLEGEQFSLEFRSRKEHENRLNTTIATLEKELQEQRKDFAEKYGREGQTQKDSLANQKQTYLKELYKQKRALDARAGLVEARKDDPFYTMKGFDASLEETENAYRLSAKVAPHEKDTVDVKVKDDKVTLSAKRGYEDQVEDKGVRVSTNTYQTYRQEFKLGAPADAKGVSKFVKEDGSISVIIPKKTYSPKG